MSDIIDRANELAELQRDEALEAHRRRSTTTNQAGISAGLCIRCGDVIDPRRLAALPMASRCIDCQKRHENNRR